MLEASSGRLTIDHEPLESEVARVVRRGVECHDRRELRKRVISGDDGAAGAIAGDREPSVGPAWKDDALGDGVLTCGQIDGMRPVCGVGLARSTRDRRHDRRCHVPPNRGNRTEPSNVEWPVEDAYPSTGVFASAGHDAGPAVVVGGIDAGVVGPIEEASAPVFRRYAPTGHHDRSPAELGRRTGGECSCPRARRHCSQYRVDTLHRRERLRRTAQDVAALGPTADERGRGDACAGDFQHLFDDVSAAEVQSWLRRPLRLFHGPVPIPLGSSDRDPDLRRPGLAPRDLAPHRPVVDELDRRVVRRREVCVRRQLEAVERHDLRSWCAASAET